MNRIRIIPTLLIKDQGLVKTTKFKKPFYVGDPINTLKIFNEKEVDELALLVFQNNVLKLHWISDSFRRLFPKPSCPLRLVGASKA